MLNDSGSVRNKVLNAAFFPGQNVAPHRSAPTIGGHKNEITLCERKWARFWPHVLAPKSVCDQMVMRYSALASSNPCLTFAAISTERQCRRKEITWAEADRKETPLRITPRRNLFRAICVTAPTTAHVLRHVVWHARGATSAMRWSSWGAKKLRSPELSTTGSASTRRGSN